MDLESLEVFARLASETKTVVSSAQSTSKVRNAQSDGLVVELSGLKPPRFESGARKNGVSQRDPQQWFPFGLP